MFEILKNYQVRAKIMGKEHIDAEIMEKSLNGYGSLVGMNTNDLKEAGVAIATFAAKEAVAKLISQRMD